MNYKSAWARFYAGRNTEEYYQHVSTKYADFITEVAKNIRSGDRVVEFGCGLSNVTRSLMKTADDWTLFVGVDIEPEMLRMSQQNLERAGVDRSYVQFYQGDARKGILVGDVAHSHGLLEHFSDKDIRTIISQQQGRFRQLLHYVPSAKYDKPSFGDERLMTPEQWKKICAPDEIIEFNDGYDLILKWT